MRDSKHCFAHDPALADERASARRKGGHNRKRRKVSEAPPKGLDSVRTVEGIQRLLTAAIRDTLVLDNSPRRSNALVALLRLATDVLAGQEVEERLKALEERV